MKMYRMIFQCQDVKDTAFFIFACVRFLFSINVLCPRDKIYIKFVAFLVGTHGNVQNSEKFRMDNLHTDVRV